MKTIRLSNRQAQQFKFQPGQFVEGYDGEPFQVIRALTEQQLKQDEEIKRLFKEEYVPISHFIAESEPPYYFVSKVNVPEPDPDPDLSEPTWELFSEDDLKPGKASEDYEPEIPKFTISTTNQDNNKSVVYNKDNGTSKQPTRLFNKREAQVDEVKLQIIYEAAKQYLSVFVAGQAESGSQDTQHNLMRDAWGMFIDWASGNAEGVADPGPAITDIVPLLGEGEFRDALFAKLATEAGIDVNLDVVAPQEEFTEEDIDRPAEGGEQILVDPAGDIVEFEEEREFGQEPEFATSLGDPDDVDIPTAEELEQAVSGAGKFQPFEDIGEGDVKQVALGDVAAMTGDAPMVGDEFGYETKRFKLEHVDYPSGTGTVQRTAQREIRDDEHARELLRSVDIGSRWNTARSIGEDGGNVSLLEPLLQDPVDDVRIEATKWIGQRGDITLLTPLLQDSTPNIRGEATDWIGQNGDVNLLEPMLGDANENVRRYAAWWIGKRGNVNLLKPLLRDSSDRIRAVAQEWIEKREKQTDKDYESDIPKFKIGQKTEQREILDENQALELLQSQEERDRIDAVNWLGQYRDANLLKPMLKDKSDTVRFEAAGWIGANGDINYLIDLLEDEYKFNVKRAAYWLAKRKSDIKASLSEREKDLLSRNGLFVKE